MKKHRYPESAALLRVSALFVIAGSLERAIHQLLQINVFLDDLSCRHAVALPQKVAAANLRRIQAKNVGRTRHVQFDSKDRLRRTEATKCTVWIRVRHHDIALHSRVFAAVRSPRVQSRSR